MKCLGLQGVRRVKLIRTTIPDKAAPWPLNLDKRQFKADRLKSLRVWFQAHVKKHPAMSTGCFYIVIGGTSGGRTHDKRIKSPLLYQLSYGPIEALNYRGKMPYFWRCRHRLGKDAQPAMFDAVGASACDLRWQLGLQAAFCTLA
jgi:hypothetical protein